MLPNPKPEYEDLEHTAFAKVLLPYVNILAGVQQPTPEEDLNFMLEFGQGEFNAKDIAQELGILPANPGSEREKDNFEDATAYIVQHANFDISMGNQTPYLRFALAKTFEETAGFTIGQTL